MRLLPLAAWIALAGCHAEQSAANRAAESNDSAAVLPAPPIANDSAAEPARPSIPQRFRGLWAENQRSCGALTHPSRLVIGERSLRFPDFVIHAEEVREPSDDSFAVRGTTKKSGVPSAAHYSLDVTGNILTDQAGGGTPRVRCG